MPHQNRAGPERADLIEDDHPPPQRQKRADEKLQPVHEVELRALAATAQDIDLMAKHGVLKHQLAPGPNGMSTTMPAISRACL